MAANLIPIFKAPLTFIICGPSQSGKTHFCVNLLLHSKYLVKGTMIKGFDLVVIIYKNWQPLYDKIKATLDVPIHFYKDEFPNQNDSEAPSFEIALKKLKAIQPVLLYDDALEMDSVRIKELFTRISHHTNTSVIFITQNIFDKHNKNLRTISLNAKIIVIFKYIRDRSQVRQISVQVFGGLKKVVQNFMKMYESQMKSPYSYLVLDFQPETADEERIKSNIFGEKWPHFITVFPILLLSSY